MAEVTRRSFDLKSWQGLTLVLKVARESHLSPGAYAEFRNLVLEYAQQKGADASLKAKIDSVIATFEEKGTQGDQQKSSDTKEVKVERHGRRVVPTFAPRPIERKPAPAVSEVKEVVEPPQAPIHEEVKDLVPPPPTPPQVSREEVPPPPAPTGPKSVEEHRARIMEIKRRVNSLVKNPIGLVDQGNQIGREYMTSLLGALKATNPGATHDLESAMASLEVSFNKILEHVSHPEEALVATPSEPMPQEQLSPEPVNAGVVPQVEPEIENPTPNIAHSDPLLEPIQEVIETSPVEGVAETLSAPTVSDLPPYIPTALPPEPKEGEREDVQTFDEKRWSEEGGDADMKEQIRSLRDQLASVEGAPKAIRGGKHSLIPSILEIEDGPTPEPKVTGSDWDPYTKKKDDDLSPSELTMRPTSSMTGVTLNTPQAELMAPDVTMALGELLHQWKIFASSGLFGMGPGGMEHPLYLKLSKLSMAEIITGRYEDADMKVVHSVKDYIDAWRHEQGIAYNPSETFEHYLRRVSQRILRRQGIR